MTTRIGVFVGGRISCASAGVETGFRCAFQQTALLHRENLHRLGAALDVDFAERAREKFLWLAQRRERR